VVIVLWGGVYIGYSCSRAKRKALTSHLTLLDRFNISVNVLESSYFVEKVERVGDDGFVSEQFGVREVFLANPLYELYLSCVYLGQVNMRCLMSSVACMQVYCGQYGVSLFRILWRCLLIGMCPVRSWVSKLACLRLSELVISRNLSDGNDWSICLSFLNLGDLFHHSFIEW